MVKKNKNRAGYLCEGKTALITGGAAGIGSRTAAELAEKGVNIIINYRTNEDRAVALARQLTEQYGTKNFAIKGDISKRNECENLTEEVFKVFESVDILIHNAGPYIHERKKMTEYSFEEWDYLIHGNLSAVFYLSKLIIPKMREKNGEELLPSVLTV